ncbi:hypothetical protein AMATHDRAFT_136395 [Amanita thiersii Skay4041]|uniref:Pet127-domain-containing protein n=1 Tax=Amanita thiersii Skay4041 TaxID=703135 RepID=A0A2A9NWX1_9AGAR|nr:hypothetical protein AMATHDRAFT_136395 [Amanita thiersii Skay4041]
MIGRCREGWKSDWGEDKLRPNTNEFELIFENHQKSWDNNKDQYPIAYTRRIEGFIEPLNKPILEDLSPSYVQRPIPTLAHGLDRALFNPGTHWLRDPRSRVYNFSPWLEDLPTVTDFAFERLTGFVKSSRDEELWQLAEQEDKNFAGSTSSLTRMLCHIYFLLSGDKDVDTTTLTYSFRDKPATFSPGQRIPASVVFKYRDGRYAIDSHSDKYEYEDKNILTWMGTLLEKFLTIPPDKFKSYMRSHPPPADFKRPTREAFRFAKSQQFVMRSQLDCHDKRLPGTGVFDIKTRACLPIRHDLLNFEEHSGYLIRSQYGPVESFEKEYYDLIRSAFLKYSFQARIGNMDGVFVAYHNIAKMFGFQYIPIEEMDERLFGRGRGTGDKVFEKCIQILEVICQEIIQCFPGQSITCTVETKEGEDNMNIWVEPAEWDKTEERPVKQLQLYVSNYLGVRSVSGHRAIEECDSTREKWNIHWTISMLSQDVDRIWVAFRKAKERQFRAYNFPSGVDASEMPEFWARLNFGGKPPSENEAPYDEEYFRTANRQVQQLREMSRRGREEANRIAAEEAGKPKIVYGHGRPWLEEGVEEDAEKEVAVEEEEDGE